jgi:Fe-S cluster biogenesis protein NfuA
LARADAYIRTHGGQVELLDADPSGRVLVRFSGACTGCPLRPITLVTVIGRFMRELPWVTSVEAENVRISDEAAARLRRYLTPMAVGPTEPPSPPEGARSPKR